MRPINILILFFISILIAGAPSFASPAGAETYIGFGAGASVPNDYSRIRLGGAAVANYDDLGTKNSFSYGFKAGHFWDQSAIMGFDFGVELNYFNRDLDATLQEIASYFPNAEHLGFRVNSFQTVSLIPLLRYKFDKFAPYVGVGLALNILDVEEVSLGNNPINTVRISQSLSNIIHLGMITSFGVSYKISENFKVFSEYKYSKSNYDLFLIPSPNTNLNFTLDAVDHNFMFGLTHEFTVF